MKKQKLVDRAGAGHRRSSREEYEVKKDNKKKDIRLPNKEVLYSTPRIKCDDALTAGCSRAPEREVEQESWKQSATVSVNTLEQDVTSRGKEMNRSPKDWHRTRSCNNVTTQYLYTMFLKEVC